MPLLTLPHTYRPTKVRGGFSRGRAQGWTATQHASRGRPTVGDDPMAVLQPPGTSQVKSLPDMNPAYTTAAPRTAMTTHRTQSTGQRPQDTDLEEYGSPPRPHTPHPHLECRTHPLAAAAPTAAAPAPPPPAPRAVRPPTARAAAACCRTAAAAARAGDALGHRGL